MRKEHIKQINRRFFEVQTLPELSEVQRIINAVKCRGDAALRELTLRYDGVALDGIRVPEDEIVSALPKVDPGLVSSLRNCMRRVRTFAEQQRKAYQDFEVEVEPGVFLFQKVFPLERVGIYVPGGRHPLISSLIMAAVPARVSGVEEIVVCSPPRQDGSLHPAVLAAASLCGIRELYRVGGAQAIAAMAYGTSSIRRVNKIVGPGNAYVTEAKRMVFGRVGIDFTAGPTEIMVIADREAEPAFVAADLIAQAEHDTDAVPVLITDSETLADEVEAELLIQLDSLEDSSVARQSLDKNGLVVIVDRLEDAAELANERAPEHLQLHVNKPERLLGMLKNFGSLFIGKFSAEVLGDYSSGLNHILPTNFAAHYTGGLGTGDFLKVHSLLKVDKTGFRKIGPEAWILANTEGLEGHAKAVSIRLADPQMSARR